MGRRNRSEESSAVELEPTAHGREVSDVLSSAGDLPAEATLEAPDGAGEVDSAAAPAETVDVASAGASEPEAPKTYRVKAGMSLTSLVGILDANRKVEPKMFHGGQQTFDYLVERGHIVAD